VQTSAENATANAVVILGIVVIILSTKFEVLVYFEISAVVVKVLNAPQSLAWTVRARDSGAPAFRSNGNPAAERAYWRLP
jgi:hypothetical protein